MLRDLYSEITFLSHGQGRTGQEVIFPFPAKPTGGYRVLISNFWCQLQSLADPHGSSRSNTFITQGGENEDQQNWTDPCSC